MEFEVLYSDNDVVRFRVGSTVVTLNDEQVGKLSQGLAVGKMRPHPKPPAEVSVAAEVSRTEQ